MFSFEGMHTPETNSGKIVAISYNEFLAGRIRVLSLIQELTRASHPPSSELKHVAEVHLVRRGAVYIKVFILSFLGRLFRQGSLSICAST
jgi:hypothetical protein